MLQVFTSLSTDRKQLTTKDSEVFYERSNYCNYSAKRDAEQAYIAGAEESEQLKQQIEKAKEIIKKFSEFVYNEVEFDLEHLQEHTDLWNELCEKAEQFIKEIKENGK